MTRSQPNKPITCQVTFQPALTRPADWELLILDGNSQAEILNRLQQILSRSDRLPTQISLRFSCSATTGQPDA